MSSEEVNHRTSCLEMNFNDHEKNIAAIYGSILQLCFVKRHVQTRSFLNSWGPSGKKDTSISPHPRELPKTIQLQFVAHLKTLTVYKIASLTLSLWQFHGLLILFWVNFTTLRALSLSAAGAHYEWSNMRANTGTFHSNYYSFIHQTTKKGADTEWIFLCLQMVGAPLV